jgi:amino acid adenylation domain-containing protein
MTYLLHHLLEASADRHGDRPAVVDGPRSLTYRELNARANQLAHLLMEIGVSKSDRVGLYLEKSLESVVAIYAVLKCGGVYVPLDPQAPAARLAYIIDNCALRVVVTGREKAAVWAQLAQAATQLEELMVINATAAELLPPVPRLTRRTADDLPGRPASVPTVGQIDADLAYVLYTSGSTGQPKGVMLSHRNALAFVDWTVAEFAVHPGDRLSNHAPLHFDLSIFDLFAAAEAGAAVVLVPPKTSVFPLEVARFIERSQVTVWYSVPSVLSMLTQHGSLRGGEFPSLRTILFAGEVFPTKHLRRLMALLPHVGFYNLYGPTETNVCTWYQVPPLPPDQIESIPIGKAIANVEVFAVTDDCRVAQPGEVGELYVRGSTVMRGYWGNEEHTAKVLVPDPRSTDAADRVYKTGDLVQQTENGNFRLLGRRDFQVKSRGYRIELGDIESALYAHPAVVECAVRAIPDDMVTNRIKAYVVARDPVSANDLIHFCAQRIPRYMLPEIIEFRSSLSKTSTGKIDRQALDTVAES